MKISLCVKLPLLNISYLDISMVRRANSCIVLKQIYCLFFPSVLGSSFITINYALCGLLSYIIVQSSAFFHHSFLQYIYFFPL